MKGAVAAGHRLTADAAAEILRAGGNAFDAVVGGFFAACVTEPVLASLGGGGFLLAKEGEAATGDGPGQVFDFFTHTPGANPFAGSRDPRPGLGDLDFYPVTVDFGAVRQEFHIGLGACAAPGTVRGMFAIHRQLCTMPMAELARPAVELARAGVSVNRFQSYLFELVGPIYRTESALPLFASPSKSGKLGKPGKLLQPGDVFRNPDLADLLEVLAREGETLFYEGEIAASIDAQCRQGGHLTRADLRNYRVRHRAPLEISYRRHRLITNPPPSAGGILIGFGLELLEQLDLAAHGFGSEAHIGALVQTLLATSEARDGASGAATDLNLNLNPQHLARYRKQVLNRARAFRGTTHISVIDAARNIASLTVSNGEGCGRLVPDAGFMLNNMLGEEDVNPGGFHRWQPDQRMASMMAPGILFAANGADGEETISALGSGGSNRIRTAILQVVCNMTDFAMDANTAIASPRVHIETEELHREANFPAATIRALDREFPGHREFPEPNMYFGGVHIAQLDAHGAMHATGDPRRDGVGVVVD